MRQSRSVFKEGMQLRIRVIDLIFLLILFLFILFFGLQMEVFPYPTVKETFYGQI